MDGTDPVAVYEHVAKAAERARTGRGPSLIESKFYRLSAHGNVITVPPLPTHFPEHEAVAVYGNNTEFEAGQAQDPVSLFRSRMVKQGVISEESGQRITGEARAEVQDAVQFALASPFPAPEDAVKYVYA